MEMRTAKSTNVLIRDESNIYGDAINLANKKISKPVYQKKFRIFTQNKKYDKPESTLIKKNIKLNDDSYNISKAICYSISNENRLMQRSKLLNKKVEITYANSNNSSNFKSVAPP